MCIRDSPLSLPLYLTHSNPLDVLSFMILQPLLFVFILAGRADGDLPISGVVFHVPIFLSSELIVSLRHLHTLAQLSELLLPQLPTLLTCICKHITYQFVIFLP